METQESLRMISWQREEEVWSPRGAAVGRWRPLLDLPEVLQQERERGRLVFHVKWWRKRRRRWRLPLSRFSHQSSDRTADAFPESSRRRGNWRELTSIGDSAPCASPGPRPRTYTPLWKVRWHQQVTGFLHFCSVVSFFLSPFSVPFSLLSFLPCFYPFISYYFLFCSFHFFTVSSIYDFLWDFYINSETFFLTTNINKLQKNTQI